MLNELDNIVEFLRRAEQLKNTLRRAYTSEGRHESTAEHTWRLCLMVLVMEKHYPDIDTLKLMKMCIVHDLGEAISGDIAAVDQVPGQNKSEQERQDLLQLVEPLPHELQNEIMALWDEYEQAESQEAKLAKALDKLETILQHTQGINPPDFNYAFNLEYGKRYTQFDPLTSQLRAILDIDTQRLADENPVD
ncbi:HD domain-containing protein [Paraneptunicella aestuarii]|uniref:HD domain-containing protein n=1 Tax=Paraneptunicella aestuarii TaxID=2831148 RepID=UPI001E5424F7|nr:HD domain-containing protein [Paraneptunicella aestuarii]UAA39725.1 HD domain-containing protein [Paraneptunicella aestuarii]